jgi:hypothetical protein
MFIASTVLMVVSAVLLVATLFKGGHRPVSVFVPAAVVITSG